MGFGRFSWFKHGLLLILLTGYYTAEAQFIMAGPFPKPPAPAPDPITSSSKEVPQPAAKRDNPAKEKKEGKGSNPPVTDSTQSSPPPAAREVVSPPSVPAPNPPSSVPAPNPPPSVPAPNPPPNPPPTVSDPAPNPPTSPPPAPRPPLPSVSAPPPNPPAPEPSTPPAPNPPTPPAPNPPRSISPAPTPQVSNTPTPNTPSPNPPAPIPPPSDSPTQDPLPAPNPPPAVVQFEPASQPSVPGEQPNQNAILFPGVQTQSQPPAGQPANSNSPSVSAPPDGTGVVSTTSDNGDIFRGSTNGGSARPPAAPFEFPFANPAPPPPTSNNGQVAGLTPFIASGSNTPANPDILVPTGDNLPSVPFVNPSKADVTGEFARETLRLNPSGSFDSEPEENKSKGMSGPMLGAVIGSCLGAAFIFGLVLFNGKNIRRWYYRRFEAGVSRQESGKIYTTSIADPSKSYKPVFTYNNRDSAMTDISITPSNFDGSYRESAPANGMRLFTMTGVSGVFTGVRKTVFSSMSRKSGASTAYSHASSDFLSPVEDHVQRWSSPSVEVTNRNSTAETVVPYERDTQYMADNGSTGVSSAKRQSSFFAAELVRSYEGSVASDSYYEIVD